MNTVKDTLLDMWTVFLGKANCVRGGNPCIPNLPTKQRPNYGKMNMAGFRDSGILGRVRTPSDKVNALSLLSGVSESQSLPTGYNYLQIRSTRDVYVKFGDNSITASVPSDTTDGSASELNGGTWLLDGSNTHIAIVSPYDTTVTLSYYQL